MGERHVVRDRGNGRWKVVGADTGSGGTTTASTQEDAITRACAELAHGEGGQVLIHGLDDTVQDTRTIVRRAV